MRQRLTAAPEAVAAPGGCGGEPQKLMLATTSSTQDSGLLDLLLPDFEQQFNADVEVVAVGTGQSLKLGADCNADVVLVHARAREDEFMNAGSGARREDVMYNDFVDRRAGQPIRRVIKGMTDAVRGLHRRLQSAVALHLPRR